MPTYEYRCNACGREFEYQQRMSDPDLVTCEACKEDKLEKLISRTAFQLKGSGWYKDLYSSSKPAEKAASTETATADKPAEKKTEATPAPSTPTPSTGSTGSSGGTTGGTSGTSSKAAAPIS